jgi:hypothetical protein
MDPALQAIRDYAAAWNEPDPARRRALLERSLVDGGEVVAPTGEWRGAAAVDAEIARWHAQQPRHTAGFADPVDAHHGWARASFVVRDGAGREVARGLDLFETTADHRIRRVITFFG